MRGYLDEDDGLGMQVVIYWTGRGAHTEDLRINGVLWGAGKKEIIP